MTRTDDLFARAQRVIPGGVPGLHRVFASGDGPLFLVRGEGAYVEDADGIAYLDCMLGKGPMILGYSHPAVNEAVLERLSRGNLLSMSTPEQVEAAEQLTARFPGSFVRWHKSGSEACTAAVRIARAQTCRRWILSSGYHGWHDWANIDAPGSLGTAFTDFHYDLDVLAKLVDRHANDVAAIFVEPVPGFLTREFYAELREVADECGALLLFDEVKSGFRVPPHTAGAAAGVRADITTLSKAIANGYCLSCCVGAPETMLLADRLHVATTFDIEATPFAAATATLRVLDEEDVVARVAGRVARVVDAINASMLSRGVPARAFAMGAMFRIGFAEAEREELFYSGMLRKRILLYPFDNQFLSLAHDDASLDRLIETADRVLVDSLDVLPPHRDEESCAGREMHEFQFRKGFLAKAPGPTGRRLGSPEAIGHG